MVKATLSGRQIGPGSVANIADAVRVTGTRGRKGGSCPRGSRQSEGGDSAGPAALHRVMREETGPATLHRVMREENQSSGPRGSTSLRLGGRAGTLGWTVRRTQPSVGGARTQEGGMWIRTRHVHALGPFQLAAPAQDVRFRSKNPRGAWGLYHIRSAIWEGHQGHFRRQFPHL